MDSSILPTPAFDLNKKDCNHIFGLLASYFLALAMMAIRSHRANQPSGFAMQRAHGKVDVSVCRSYLFFISVYCAIVGSFSYYFLQHLPVET
jgi:hypothetical protein